MILLQNLRFNSHSFLVHFTVHCIEMAAAILYNVCPQCQITQPNSINVTYWKCNRFLLWIGYLFILVCTRMCVCVCERALGWQKPERSPSLIPFYFILHFYYYFFAFFVFLLLLLLIEFHLQNLSWQTYGIALLRWHRT